MGNNHLHQTCTAAKLWRISPHDPQATVPALRINGGIRAIADIGRAFKLNMVIDHRYGLLVPPVVEEPPAQTSPQSHTPKKSFCAHQASLNELQRSPSESGSPAHNRDACEVYPAVPCETGQRTRKRAGWAPASGSHCRAEWTPAGGSGCESRGDYSAWCHGLKPNLPRYHAWRQKSTRLTSLPQHPLRQQRLSQSQTADGGQMRAVLLQHRRCSLPKQART